MPVQRRARWRTCLPVFLLVPQVTCAGTYEEDDGEAPEDGLGQHHLTAETLRKLHPYLDIDGSGNASLGEVMEYLYTARSEEVATDVLILRDEMDVDKDGKVSWTEMKKEFESWSEVHLEDKERKDEARELEIAKFGAADVDKDELLSAEELIGYLYPHANAAVLEIVTQAALHDRDEDEDGVLSIEEFWSLINAPAEQGATDQEIQDFNELDTNRDGKLIVKELMIWESGDWHLEGTMKKLFEVADRDNDGNISLSEMEESHEAISGIDAQYHMLSWAYHLEL